MPLSDILAFIIALYLIVKTFRQLNGAIASSMQAE